MPYKISQLMLTPKRNAATSSDIFIAQTDAYKESLAGKLFLLAEIESKKSEALKIINFLIDNIFVNYYQNEKIILREKISTLKVEHIFESALAKTNANFADFIKKEKIKIRPEELNVTIGVVHEDSIYFTNTGKNKVFLIYRSGKNNYGGFKKGSGEKTESEKKNYNIIDIAEKTLNNSEKPKNEKIFANVINGQLPPKGYFLVASEALPEYISHKQLTEIITTLPPASAVEQLKNILGRINVYVSFLGIIIKTSSIDGLEEKTKPAKQSSGSSISALSQTEERTENLLSPSGIINAKKWLKYFRINIFKPKAGRAAPGQSTLDLKEKIFFKKSPLLFFQKTFRFLKNIAIYFLNFLFFIFKTATGKQPINISFKNTASIIAAKIKGAFSLAARLNKKSKVLLAALIALAAIFSINLIVIKEKNKTIEEENTYQEISSMIEQKQNQAEANLLYSNNEGAIKLFKEIEELLRQLPKTTEEQARQADDFKTKLDKQMEKIRNVSNIENPEELADFSNLNSRAKPDNIALIRESGKIFAADSSEKSIYILNLSDNLVTTLTDMDQEINYLKSPAPGADNSVYYFNGSSMIAIDGEDMEINALTINLPADPGAYKAADTYNGRLYLMETQNSNIHRFNRSGAGFSSAYGWLAAGIDISNAVDMSIDGNIYVAKENGEVLKLLRGEAVDFKLENPDPELSAPDKIYASPDLDYLYILEPEKKRLAVFDKDGRFLIQYTSEKFDNLSDFALDEENKKIYILNGSKIFVIPAEHIQVQE